MRVQITGGITNDAGDFIPSVKIFDERTDDGPSTPVDILSETLSILDRVDYSQKSGRIIKVAKELHEYESMTLYTAHDLADCILLSESFEGVLNALPQPAKLETVLYAAEFLDRCEETFLAHQDEPCKFSYVITRLHPVEPQSN